MKSTKSRNPGVNLKTLIITVLTYLMLFVSTPNAAEPMKVGFINPDNPGNPFWDNVTRFMQEAAKDLNVEFSVVYGNANRFEAARKAEKLMRSADKPDYLIYIYQHTLGKKILKAAEETRVKSFIINTNIANNDQDEIGKPRQNFKQWIGHMYPDDVGAGRILSDLLIQEARAQLKLKSGESLGLLGLSGTRDSSAAIDRNLGLEQSLKQHAEVTKHQIVFAGWDTEEVASRTVLLLKRYPQTHLLWGASDGIALGGVKAALERGKVVGKDLFVGGIDWSEAGIQAVRQGTLVTTLGGHFMEGGWAMVMLYDYHHGKDFEQSGTTINSQMQAITQQNVTSYQEQLGNQEWEKIDFRRFSKVLNAEVTEYDFSLSNILKNFN